MPATASDTERATRGACPVIEYDFVTPRPPLHFFTELDALREASPVYWNEWAGMGFWMLTRFAEVREAYQNPEVFCSDSVVVTDPEPAYKWIPTHVNPPEHLKYRHLLNARFSPTAVFDLEDANRAWCAQIVDDLVAKGECDFIAEFSGIFPTGVFLNILGLPWSDAPQFSQWVTEIFEGMADPTLQDQMYAAMAGVQDYFARTLADRHVSPRDPQTDFVSFLLQSEVDDRPVTDEEILNICGVLVLAGLDTMKCQLGLAFHHFATHPEDRQRLLDDPSLIPSTVEEILRTYAIVMDGRKLAQDIDFHGCPMKKGDMVMLTLPAANRDPGNFENGQSFVMDRKHNAHVGFAAGPHRCLGSHLARQELALAIEEWHRRIPHYSIAPGAEVVAHGAQIGLMALPLVWDV
jgi:cytochrome P450